MATLSRREFLGTGLFLAVQASAASTVQPFFRRTHLPIGLQLYTVGQDLKRDFAATLAAVADIGYTTVELAGLGDHTAAQWHHALRQARLGCPSIHVPARAPTARLSLEGDLGILAESANLLGIRTVVCPTFRIPDHFSPAPLPGENGGKMLARIGASMTADDWKWNADYLNKKGAALKPLGLSFAYHNHNVEFTPVGNLSGMALLIQGTDPSLVSFEMDAGWVVAAGADPIALLNSYPHRFTAMHVKDIKASTHPNFSLQQDPCEVGSGMIDWKMLLAKAHAQKIRQFYVEQEPPFSKPPLQSVAISFRYLDALVV